MEITTFGMYLFTRLDSINDVLGLTFGISVVFLGVCTFFYFLLSLDSRDHDIRDGLAGIIKSKLFIFILIFSGISGCLLPTSKQAAVIYLVPKLANNEQIKQLPDNAVNLLNKQLEAWIADFDIKDKGE